jgi:hypothetical protein
VDEFGAFSPSPSTLRAAVARRGRDQRVVLVLHPAVRLDDAAFEEANPGVIVRRNRNVPSMQQVFVFDLAELLGGGFAQVTEQGVHLVHLPGSDPRSGFS